MQREMGPKEVRESSYDVGGWQGWKWRSGKTSGTPNSGTRESRLGERGGEGEGRWESERLK